MYDRHLLGKNGEDRVEEYLKNKGYLIVARNFDCRQGEIDLIARDKKELVFIEVKTRSSNQYGTPAEAVTDLKRKHIFKSAEYFLYKYHLEAEYIRIDVIEVYAGNNNTYKINHIQQAF